MTDPYSVHRY